MAEDSTNMRRRRVSSGDDDTTQLRRLSASDGTQPMRQRAARPAAASDGGQRAARPAAARTPSAQTGGQQAARQGSGQQAARQGSGQQATRQASSQSATRQAGSQRAARQGNGQQASRQASGQRRGTAARMTPERRALRERGRQLSQLRALGVRISAGVLVVGALVGLLFFLRPKTSQVEKRDLTAFPAFTVSSFLDGSYFSNVALWYSDTYPARDTLVGLSQAMKSRYGIQPKTQLVGGAVKADELPVAGEKTDKDADAEKDAEEKKKEEEAKKDEGPAELPTTHYLAEEIQDKIMQGLYVDGDAAYNIYYFDQESVQLYADAINLCQKNLEGVAQVYSILAPTSGGALLDEDLLASLGGTDQREATKYFMSLYDDTVKGVNIYDAMRAHRDEYIYFRTDHHWTELGAYYAYVEFCKAKGVEPSDIFARKKMRFEPFLGTFYSEVGNDAMEANPDYVDAWVPNSTNDMVVWDTDGNQLDVNVITDVSEWSIYSQYACFISGDRPLTRIDNPDKTDGSQCLVIKDSYGCAFVPLLVDDYQTTWVIDFRYSDRSVPDFVREQGIDDVIYLNAIVLAGSYSVGEMQYAQAQSYVDWSSSDATTGDATASDGATAEETTEETTEA